MRQFKKVISVALLVAVSALALSGCSGSAAPRFVNELEFPLGGIEEITVSYDEEDVIFLKGLTSKLVLKEYMTRDAKSYHADVSEGDGSIHISEGGKPLFGRGFERHVEVYLPVGYSGDLTITTTSGTIDLTSPAVNAATLRIDSTSGSIRSGSLAGDEIHISTTSGRIECRKLMGGAVRLETTSGSAEVREVVCAGAPFSAHTTSGAFVFGDVEAGDIELETTSGDTVCQSLKGAVSCVTTSGSIEVASAAGSGRYEAGGSGEINVAYGEVTGDLSLFGKNGDMALTIPPALEFTFEARSRNGAITTPFREALTVEDGKARGAVGPSPTVNIQMETNDGDIRVAQ